MENTEINKVKFFAQYWGQKVFVNPILDSRPVNNTYLFGYDEPEDIEMEYLELKPLSLITDEDAIECVGVETFNLYQNDENNGVYGMSASGMFVDEISFYVNETTSADYLRSKGYALPWLQLSVEEMIEYGWIKLKSE